MSHLMTQAVIRMPYEMAMGNEISRRQYYDRANQVLDEMESYAAARVSEALEEAALIVDLATQHHHVECWGSLESLAGRIRALTPSTPA